MLLLASKIPKKRGGRKKFRETRHPVYRGVRWKNFEKWVSEVRVPGKKSRIWLGTFPNAEMAARAHDVAVMALKGRSACLNFADSAWRLPVPASATAKDIQKAAAEATETFRASESLERENSEEGENSEEVTIDEQVIQDIVVPKFTEYNELFMDEEAIFYMPELLVNMAEGLMLPPPQCTYGMEPHDIDMSLWSY
ncbi:dehydration-responsive element-binding protein 1B-like [Solanum tuberosum]|uniref:dehydration-responsive element-binding protein 1B-like n=1 Tax=Solanum tuberosum TaxID=4113 RepID=UPI00073A2AA8|nr:PREDICTED: dehydration-responsive element-binding protein 1B-like [Solanum tuberosum]